VVQSRAGAGHFDAPGHLELIAAERDDAHGNAGRERLLCGALTPCETTQAARARIGA
jgi:hypothetical protein